MNEVISVGCRCRGVRTACLLPALPFLLRPLLNNRLAIDAKDTVRVLCAALTVGMQVGTLGILLGRLLGLLADASPVTTAKA